MFKTLTVLLALLAGSVSANDTASVVVSADSKLVERGVLVTDETTVGLDLRFNDVLLPGLFVRGEFDSTQLTPLDNTVKFRSDLGVGFAGEIADSIQWEASINRVLNPVIYSDDYTEATFRVARGVLFGELSQGFTSDVNKNTYINVGLQKSYDRFTVGGLVSTVRYNDDSLQLRDEFEFNNAELFAKYNVWRDLDISVNYSYGGEYPSGAEIDNQFWGGVSYRF